MTPGEQRPEEDPTLMQHPDISSTSDSSLVHSAAANWGAVMFVGSVRTRDLYSNPCEACGGSATMPCSERKKSPHEPTHPLPRSLSIFGGDQRRFGYVPPQPRSNHVQDLPPVSVTYADYKPSAVKMRAVIDPASNISIL